VSPFKGAKIFSFFTQGQVENKIFPHTRDEFAGALRHPQFQNSLMCRFFPEMKTAIEVNERHAPTQASSFDAFSNELEQIRFGQVDLVFYQCLRKKR
jgi:hypothetical protein